MFFGCYDIPGLVGLIATHDAAGWEGRRERRPTQTILRVAHPDGTITAVRNPGALARWLAASHDDE